MSLAESMQQSWKDRVRAASVGANVNTASPGTTLDGVTLAVGNRVLLKDQTTPSQNGPWVWNGSATAMTRPFDFTSGSTILAPSGHRFAVTEGTVNARSSWACTTVDTITIDTTSITYTREFPDYLSKNPLEPWPLGQTMLRREAQTTVTLASGTLQLYNGVVLMAGQVYTALNAFFAVASSGLTHSWGGIVRQSDRALLAVSADNTAAITIGSTRAFTFTSAYTPTVDTPVWLALCLVAGTTVPSIPAMSSINTTLSGLAPVMAGASNTAQTTPLAVNTVVTAPTATGILGLLGLS